MRGGTLRVGRWYRYLSKHILPKPQSRFKNGARSFLTHWIYESQNRQQNQTLVPSQDTFDLFDIEHPSYSSGDEEWGIALFLLDDMYTCFFPLVVGRPLADYKPFIAESFGIQHYGSKVIIHATETSCYDIDATELPCEAITGCVVHIQSTDVPQSDTWYKKNSEFLWQKYVLADKENLISFIGSLKVQKIIRNGKYNEYIVIEEQATTDSEEIHDLLSNLFNVERLQLIQGENGDGSVVWKLELE